MKYALVIVAAFAPSCHSRDPGVSADLHDMISGLATDDLMSADRAYLEELWGDSNALAEFDHDFDLFDLNGDSAIDPQELREYPKGQQAHAELKKNLKSISGI